MVRFLHPPKERVMKKALYHVKLTQLLSNHNNVRTKEILGYCSGVPTKGKRFVMSAPPLDKSKEIRVLTTTTLKSVRKDGKTYHFETQNSKYKLEVQAWHPKAIVEDMKKIYTKLPPRGVRGKLV